MTSNEGEYSVPEGHTIHRIARDHQRHLAGDEVEVSSPQGRFAEEASKLDGRELKGVEAKGKHLLYHFTGAGYVHIHLGLYGKFRLSKQPLKPPRGQVRLRVIGSRYGFDLNGPNRCELMGNDARKALLDRLGEDPLRRDADPDRVWDRVSKSRSAIGGLLLNQSVISGVGNIYRAEALFALGISPFRLGKEVSQGEFDELWALLSAWLRVGVKYNRIITADAKEHGKSLSRLNKNERLLIYKKPHCPTCASEVSVTELAARKIYYCGQCQT